MVAGTAAAFMVAAFTAAAFMVADTVADTDRSDVLS